MQKTTKAQSHPQVSLIVAVYEHADFLEKIFISLQSQTFTDFEIIVADDGSGESIIKCIEKYAPSFKRSVKHVHHEHKGFRKTIIINKAVTQSEGEYLLFIDGDCILHHRFIEFHAKRKRKGTVVSGRRVMMNKEVSTSVTLDDIRTRKIEKRSFWTGKCDRSTAHHGFFMPGIFHIRNLKKRKVHDILGSNFSVYKSDFVFVNGYDERIIGRGMEDDNLSVRFAMAGIPVKTIAQEALQYHLFHTSDPIPHSKEIIAQYRDNPQLARTPYGMLKCESAGDK